MPAMVGRAARGGQIMQPEERLDALLSRRLRERTWNNTAEETVNGTDELEPLLDAAERLSIQSDAEPSSTFADQLEAALLSRFAASATDTATAGHSSSGGEAPMAVTTPPPSYASNALKPGARESSNVR